MAAELSPDELEEFLALPLVATLATYRRNGTVLLSPVWHEWRDGGFNVLLETDDVKTRHIRADHRVGLVVYDDAPPYRGVEARGEGTLVDHGYTALLERMAQRSLPKGLP